VRRFHLLLLSACVVLAALVGVVVLTRPPQPAAASSESPAVGGAFQLVDQNGRAVDQRILNGKWTAVFFGYTYCPDACPTELQELAAVQDQLGARSRDFQILFITVDPARDTPSKLKSYLSTHGFPNGVIGLTGSPDQVARAAKAYHVYYAREGSGSDYLMDHSVATYLMNPDGRFATVLAPGESPQAVANQILRQMQSRA
jgi:protein SCO1/2